MQIIASANPLIGVFSDVHDNVPMLIRMYDIFRERGIGIALFLGDFCSPIVAKEIVKQPVQVHAVFGNGDGDRFAIGEIARQSPTRLVLYGEYGEISINNTKIALTHYPFYAQALARTGDFAAAFAGHTHERSVQRYGQALCANPGEVMGYKGRPSCLIYNVDTQKEEFIELVA